MDFRFSLVGLLLGVLIGLTGMGGGSLLAPIMLLLFRVPPVMAVSVDITYSTITKALGAFIHIRQKHVNLKVALWLSCGSIPATILSIFFVQFVRKHYGQEINSIIVHGIGIALLLVALLLVVKPYLNRIIERRMVSERKQAYETEGLIIDRESSTWHKRWRPVVTALVGAFVGFLVGLTSVGSGTLIIASMAFLFPRLTPKELVGTDVFQAFLLLAAGAITLMLAGSINWGMVGLLLIGSLPGVFIGSKLSKYLPDRIMNPLVAVVLAISGFKLI